MLRFAFIVLLLGVISTVLSSQSSIITSKRDSSPGCPADATNAAGNVSNFMLSAQFSIDDTSPQIPLVLAGESPNYVIATAASAESSQRTNFTMVESGLSVPSALNNGITPKISSTVFGGGYLNFTDASTGTSPAQQYCEFFNTDPAGSLWAYPLLAVESDSDDFWLCSTPSGQTNVVFGPSKSSSLIYGYDVDTCEPVVLLMVQQE